MARSLMQALVSPSQTNLLLLMLVGAVMDHLKDRLTRKVIELALAEKKNARNSQKIAAAEGQQNTFMGNFADVDEGGESRLRSVCSGLELCNR